jgi:hypothetical protein
MMVTGHLGAVFRTVLETMRTLFVWLVGLLLFYTPLGMGRLGEKWTAWSPLQALGCVGRAGQGRFEQRYEKGTGALRIVAGACLLGRAHRASGVHPRSVLWARGGLAVVLLSWMLQWERRPLRTGGVELTREELQPTSLS